jgi:hypothetical protein
MNGVRTNNPRGCMKSCTLLALALLLVMIILVVSETFI